jgi:hypothetical protein
LGHPAQGIELSTPGGWPVEWSNPAGSVRHESFSPCEGLRAHVEKVRMHHDSFWPPQKGTDWRYLLALSAALAACSAGCRDRLTVPANTRLLDQSAPYTYTDQDWALVLRNYVRDGLVDYTSLARNREPLDRYYALLGVTGPSLTPDQFPTAAHATAYWINAYNALAILFVLNIYPVETIYDMDPSMPKIELATFRVDGRTWTLPEIEARILRVSDGDVRALFATCQASLGTPRLSSEPMRAATLERQLAQAAADALNNPKILRIDSADRKILVWHLIPTRKDDFLNYWRTRRRTQTAHLLSVLADMASAQRRRMLQGAVGYVFQAVPFDRRLNDWRPGTSAATPGWSGGDRPLVP